MITAVRINSKIVYFSLNFSYSLIKFGQNDVPEPSIRLGLHDVDSFRAGGAAKSPKRNWWADATTERHTDGRESGQFGRKEGRYRQLVSVRGCRSGYSTRSTRRVRQTSLHRPPLPIFFFSFYFHAITSKFEEFSQVVQLATCKHVSLINILTIRKWTTSFVWFL